MKTALITTALMLQLSVGMAQDAVQTRSWQNLYEQLADYDDVEDDNLEDLYEHLCELEDNPIDLNNATDDD